MKLERSMKKKEGYMIRTVLPFSETRLFDSQKVSHWEASFGGRTDRMRQCHRRICWDECAFCDVTCSCLVYTLQTVFARNTMSMSIHSVVSADDNGYVHWGKRINQYTVA
jgi:hypothetical protein